MHTNASKKLFRTLFFFTFGLSALFVLLARLYTISCTDVSVMYTALPEVLSIIINIVECTIFGIAYAYLIWVAYSRPACGIRRYVILYAVSVLFKYLLNYMVTWLTDTGMSAAYLLENLSYILIYATIELLQGAIVLWMTLRITRQLHAYVAHRQSIAANLPDVHIDVRSEVFPFAKLLSWQNPLQRCALIAGMTVSAFKVVSRMIYDFTYGLPTSVVDGMWMLIYYLMDLFIGFAICMLITYLLMTLDSRAQKADHTA